MGQPDLELLARELLAEAYRDPWIAVGEGPEGWFVVSKGAAVGGKAPRVCLCDREEDARLIAAAPTLLVALLAALATLRAIGRARG